ncbi:MAG: polysaccharide deacetylase family protein, partial [Mariprofundaceae bacterium]
AIRVIRDEILRKYPFPATVSVITSEIEDGGLFPKRAMEMQQVARSIFALPNVEIASHTYSHPFNWARAAVDPHAHLNIPDYTYSLEKEVLGSVAYINNHLAPADKKVKVFLWSGDALPGAKALSLAASLGLRNMNGGNTVATSDHPSLTDISSMIRPVDGQVQVYAPVMNENLYTHNWTRPRYGFERVIETFILTDRPRRLKPIDIYYHFYSGSEIASLTALKHVYDWSMQQQVLPVWVSQYVDKVQAYVLAVAARRLDGSWLLRAPEALRTVRLDKSMGWPDLNTSHGIAGVIDLPQGRYIHLLGEGGDTLLRLRQRPPSQIYLLQANAELRHWLVQGKRIRLRLAGHMPVRFSLSQRCVLHLGKKKIEPVKQGRAYQFRLQAKDTGDALLICR